VLLISVNPFSSTSNNGKTFASFFAGYPSDSIAQLYFHRELPSSTVCDSYFRITDEDLLKDILRPWRVTGNRVSSLSTSHTPIPARAHTALKGSRAARLLRQLLWTTVRLDNPKLLAWLDGLQPEVIFFCGGDAASLYPKVARLADRYSAKVAFYITDDYVLPIRSGKVSARLMRWWTRYVFTRLTARADLVLTIGERMSATYEREFGFASVPIMNMVSVPSLQPAPRTRTNQRDALTLLYAGSLHSNRWRVLAEIVEAIHRLHERGISIRLQVFGPEPAAEARAAVHRPPYAVHGGLLSPEELSRAIARADILVHVEAEDPESMAVTALSISTKIPEYLASGRGILAIGPTGLASIDYLSANAAAIVLEPNDKTGLDRALESLSLDPNVGSGYAERAFELARSNHDATRTRRMLWSRLKDLVE
jgi:glycosyltransferase involved in cell wall biosynthesis